MTMLMHGAAVGAWHGVHASFTSCQLLNTMLHAHAWLAVCTTDLQVLTFVCWLELLVSLAGHPEAITAHDVRTAGGGNRRHGNCIYRGADSPQRYVCCCLFIVQLLRQLAPLMASAMPGNAQPAAPPLCMCLGSPHPTETHKQTTRAVEANAAVAVMCRLQATMPGINTLYASSILCMHAALEHDAFLVCAAAMGGALAYYITEPFFPKFAEEELIKVRGCCRDLIPLAAAAA